MIPVQLGLIINYERGNMRIFTIYLAGCGKNLYFFFIGKLLLQRLLTWSASPQRIFTFFQQECV